MTNQSPKLTLGDRADALRLTWQLIRKSGLSFGVALKKAYDAIRAKLKLALTDERGIWLIFRKVDGTVRTVLATRNPKHIPAGQQPKGNAPSAGNVITYFDIWAAQWKSFRADSLLFC